MKADHHCPKTHVIFHPGYMHERHYLKTETKTEISPHDNDSSSESDRISLSLYDPEFVNRTYHHGILRLDMDRDDLSLHGFNYMNTVYHHGRIYENVTDEGLLEVLDGRWEAKEREEYEAEKAEDPIHWKD